MTEDGRKITFNGVEIVADANVPEGVVYVVPHPPVRPNETESEYRIRCARMAVKIVNIAPPAP